MNMDEFKAKYKEIVFMRYRDEMGVWQFFFRMVTFDDYYFCIYFVHRELFFVYIVLSLLGPLLLIYFTEM